MPAHLSDEPLWEQAQPSPAWSRWLSESPALCLSLAAGSFAGDVLPTCFYLSPIAERITFCSAV